MVVILNLTYTKVAVLSRHNWDPIDSMSSNYSVLNLYILSYLFGKKKIRLKNIFKHLI